MLLELRLQRLIRLFRHRLKRMNHIQHVFYLLGGIPSGLVIQLIRLYHALIGQRADTNHEKFIQIRKINGGKFQTLKQRHILPQCLRQTALVKLQQLNSRFTIKCIGSMATASFRSCLLVIIPQYRTNFDP